MWMLFLVSALLGVSGSEVAPSAASQQLQALHCPPCERIHCSTRRALKLQCRGGVTTGVCGCCPVCARTEGETCGGTWDYLGKCDEGLLCVYQDAAEDNQEQERKGTCEAVMVPQAPETCRPECTREYCQENPSEICSARSVSLDKKSCQDSCQHTSCSSCLLLKPPSCPQTCASSDSSCLHRFGKCVHHHLTAPHSPVCHNNLQNHPEGHFVCFVPACQNTPK
ncbi:cysteine-rich motor neuron 1 protein-like [Solea senegalensis]|uniref:Cysteine-rich motor neuron 1 protein-like n=1 Tax=Solea senegalensis TaxID=28829 RepID=A0AAV6T212_SOLSE|nr:IGFBP domain-containing protein [Solea senegalensis]KAG7523441.1 cysteine-rich motor neuron 1 protein-like [Solea senegalensis]